ncbi:MAG: hypothetical protein NXI20_19230 [bacterium]|jgi:hypothetical protein|nr:hypothetical protein [bacterium]
MNFKQFMEDFATEINGQFSEYDENKSVIIVPLHDERFQTVIGKMYNHDRYNRNVLEFTTKVCTVDESIDYKSILEASEKFVHSKFIVEENFLKVESATFVDNSSHELLKEMIQEVAITGDEWEFKITGKDIH